MVSFTSSFPYLLPQPSTLFIFYFSVSGDFCFEEDKAKSMFFLLLLPNQSVWGKATNNCAGRQYHDFGNEVRQLHGGLVALTKVFVNTTNYLEARGLEPPGDVSFAWDRASFLEIVGDFEETLTECIRLLENNRSYSSTTGPVDNITWNVFIQPNVDRLQGRLQFHNTKLALVLKPFEL